MAVPDHFVIVGAQRCGTTYLTRLLDEHPEIEMAKPLRPEPKFFLDDEQYARGLAYYESRFFTESGPRVRGEKSTSYIESEAAAERIVSMIPNATIVVLLRDPVRRAVSNYRFSVEHGSEDLPLAEALRASVSGERPWDATRFSVSPHAYLPRGRYIDYLERFARHASSDQLHVVFFEELVAGRRGVAACYDRLGVDPTFRPDALGSVVNATDGDDSVVEPAFAGWMRDYFRESDRRLAAFLGRRLPWST